MSRASKVMSTWKQVDPKAILKSKSAERIHEFEVPLRLFVDELPLVIEKLIRDVPFDDEVDVRIESLGPLPLWRGHGTDDDVVYTIEGYVNNIGMTRKFRDKHWDKKGSPLGRNYPSRLRWFFCDPKSGQCNFEFYFDSIGDPPGKRILYKGRKDA